MKLLPLFSIFILFILQFACTMKKKPLTISVINEYGDGRSLMYISSNKSKADSLNKTLTEDPAQITRFRSFRTFIISPEAIGYIDKYISSNCNNIDQNTQKALAMFIVASSASMQTCYYYDKASSTAYFGNMVHWIEKSKYKDECKEIVSYLKPYSEIK